MLYTALDNGLIGYIGNNINKSCDLDPKGFNGGCLFDRVSRIHILTTYRKRISLF